MQEPFWWWQCMCVCVCVCVRACVRACVCVYIYIYIISHFTRLHTPFPPSPPSLISRVVSVDVEHHVYLLFVLRTYLWCSLCALDLQAYQATQVFVVVLHFSSVRFKTVAMRLEKPICAPSCLSEVSVCVCLYWLSLVVKVTRDSKVKAKN